MHLNTRALIATLVITLVNEEKNSRTVYDYTQCRHIRISGVAESGVVNLYDHDRGCHFSGPLNNLFDYGRNCFVSLQLNGKNFSGYDYGDGHHFSGTVSNNTASLYDYGTCCYFDYSV